MVETEMIKPVMGTGQFTPRDEKGWITGHGLVKEFNRLKQVIVCQHIKSHRAELKCLRTSVKIEGDEIGSRALFDRRLFIRREFRL